MTNLLLSKMNSTTGQIALLIDPDKTQSENELLHLFKKAEFAKIDYFFVGGSTVQRHEIERVVEFIKLNSSIPVVLFPGASHQLSGQADALLFLNLISGRNPDFLISHHVQCAEEVFNMQLEVISTGYILIDGGSMSSVAYVSQTTPIPRNQETIALKTALAGYLMGQHCLYFDAGSGANHSVPASTISLIRKHINTPIIVGGGLKSSSQLFELNNAGANVLVVGNRIEEDSDFLLDIAEYKSVIHSKQTN